jgi:hypothetical protein
MGEDVGGGGLGSGYVSLNRSGPLLHNCTDALNYTLLYNCNALRLLLYCFAGITYGSSSSILARPMRIFQPPEKELTRAAPSSAVKPMESITLSTLASSA